MDLREQRDAEGKPCTHCGEFKAFDLFGRHSEMRDGRNSWCRGCCNAYGAARVKADRTQANEYKRQARRRAGVPPRLHDFHVRAHLRALRALAAPLDRLLRAARRPKRPQRTAANRTAKKRAWLTAHPEVKRAKKAKRRAAKLQATPMWADPVKIREWYFAATVAERDTGFAWHVDHIVPLNNPLVCGLHCEANLQLLPGAMNVEKSNRYWPDMPE